MESEDENENNRNRCVSRAGLSISLGGLPRDVFFDILSRLPVSSLLQCKLVSQLYYSSVKHPMTTSMHLSRANNNNPFLICFSDYPKSKLDIVDLSSHENMFLARTPKLPFESISPVFDVVGSCNGLLCLYNRSCNDPLFIYNPFTREYRELPRLISPTHLTTFRVVFGFGFHPRTKEYKAIKIVYYTEGNNFIRTAIKETEVYVLTLGDPEWRHIGQKPHAPITCPASDVLVNGNLHWLTTIHQIGEEICRDIISFDLATEEFQVIPQPTGLVTHLVTLNNRLSAVISSQFGENEIWVLKDYNLKESWTKELVIPDYVPEGFRMNYAPPTKIRMNGTRNRAFRVLCSLEGGDEILFSYMDRCLVSFNPDHGEFKDFRTEGLPIEFEAIVHVGSLISVDAAFAGHPTQRHIVA